MQCIIGSLIMPARPSSKSRWTKEALRSWQVEVKGNYFEGQTEEKRIQKRIMKLWKTKRRSSLDWSLGYWLNGRRFLIIWAKTCGIYSAQQGYRSHVFSRWSSWGVMLATYLHLMLLLRVHEFRSAYLYYPFHLHGMVHSVAQNKLYLGNIKS